MAVFILAWWPLSTLMSGALRISSSPQSHVVLKVLLADKEIFIQLPQQDAVRLLEWWSSLMINFGGLYLVKE